MQTDNTILRKLLSQDLMDVMIRAGVVIFLVVMCAQVISPFVNLALWSITLAIALYPLHQYLVPKVGGKQGRASTVLVLAGLLLIGAPVAMLGSSFASHVHTAHTNFENGTLTLPQPKAAVAQWPLVGERVFKAWSSAATDLPAYVHKNKEELKTLARRGLAMAASTAGGVLLFLGSLIVAGILMAYGEGGSQAMQRIIGRLTTPERGPELQRLTTATVRSVATGVIGVAFIQALLLGVGFLLADVPAAGVLAAIVMVLGILQLPATLLTIPVIIWLWSSGDASNTMNLVFTIYLIVAGLSDNVLKPVLLGRGVDAPMPVILLGALGGMVSAGIVGMFIGAVLLAVGYQLFMEWVDYSVDDAAAAAPQSDPSQASVSQG
jgi:predicted PurR-regulated permease PerM